MKNFKVRVESKVESRKAQELLFELGFSWIGEQAGDFWETPTLWIYAKDDDKMLSDSFSKETFYEEITLPELQDMVVLKRNDINDAQYVDNEGFKVYVNSGELTTSEPQKDQRVEYFEKFLNGEKIQYRIGIAAGSDNSQWHNLTWNALKDMKHPLIEFQEAPKYVKLNGFEFKSVESLLKHVKSNYNLES